MPSRLYAIVGYGSLFVVAVYFGGFFLFSNVPESLQGPSVTTEVFLIELIALSVTSFWLALRPPQFKTRRAEMAFVGIYLLVVLTNILLWSDTRMCLDSFSIECG
jgi:hypothetical protein